MKDFIQSNFPELLLTVIGIGLVLVLVFSMHVHDDTTAGWARTSIGAVIVSIATLVNSIKQPKPNGTTSVTVEETSKEKKS